MQYGLRRMKTVHRRCCCRCLRRRRRRRRQSVQSMELLLP